MTQDKHNAPTRLIRNKKTRLLDENAAADETVLITDDDKKAAATEKLSDADMSQAKEKAKPKASPKTRIFRGSRSSKKVSAESDSFNPVTGWLVIISGPGRGRSIALGYGAQKIGRNSDQDISLNFGDEEISREKHAGIVYDPKGCKFYLQPGDGTNLVYLNDAPVLSPTELESGHTIQLGGTSLCFVAFCGQDFNWNDED